MAGVCGNYRNGSGEFVQMTVPVECNVPATTLARSARLVLTVIHPPNGTGYGLERSERRLIRGTGIENPIS
jgi:hypothetical protein